MCGPSVFSYHIRTASLFPGVLAQEKKSDRE
jgi:hypothetical protein